jgi:periplasmic divalent cation tolerance protein
VKGKLAACVNIIPQVKSIYEWEGKLEEEDEVLLIIKAKNDHIDLLKKAVLANHPYDVPEFISLPIEKGSEAYLKWMNDQIGSPDLTEK